MHTTVAETHGRIIGKSRGWLKTEPTAQMQFTVKAMEEVLDDP